MAAACPKLLAATIVVNSVEDPPGFDGSLTVGTLGPTVTLRDAVTAANNTPGDDLIHFDPALNGSTILLNQTTTTLPAHSASRANDGPTAIRISSNIELIAPPGGIVIRPSGLARLFDIAAGATVRVERVTMRGGVGTNGGGFFNAGHLTLDQVVMTSCVASSLFISNTQDLGYGGCVFNSGHLVARESTFAFNNGQSAGGAIFNTASGSLLVTDCVFENNVSEYAGPAIGNEATHGNARVSHSVFKGNKIEFVGAFQIPAVVYAGGGAVLNAGTLELEACVFESNATITANWGGAVLNLGTMSLSDSTFEANRAEAPIARGGAVYNGGTLGLTNCTFTANESRFGSAVANNFGLKMRMVNCTVARNLQDVPESFALDLGAVVNNDLRNNLIVENDRWDEGTSAFIPANLTGGFPAAGTNIVGQANVLLGDLANNGGPVKTMALLIGSPAVNTGFAIAGLDTDARGEPRYGPPDLGAYELPTNPPAFTSPGSALFTKGRPNSFQFTADSGLPVSFAPLSALPDGVDITLGGLLSGDPTAPSGVYPLTLRAFTAYSFSDVPFLLTITDGSFGDRYSWQLSGGAAMTNGVFTLTDGGVGQSRSAWYLYKQDINSFHASFDYLNVGGDGDGVAFVLQNDPAGPLALGGAGGGLGYQGISQSFALMANIWVGSPGGRGLQVSSGGAGLGTNSYINTAPVDLGAGDPIRFDLLYLEGVLAVTLSNLTSGATFTTNFPADIPGAVLGNEAWIGLTAATGGATATQRVSNFTFASLSATQTIVVNDATDPAGFSTNLIFSTLGPNITLRDALTVANNYSGPSVIRFAPSLAGATIDLSQAGATADGHTALEVRKDITIENNTGGDLTVGRGIGGDLRLFRVRPEGRLTLRKLRLENGRAAAFGVFGGNIDNLGDLVLEDCVVAGGYAWSGGGGLRNAGTCRIERTTFESNAARNAGGGIFNAGTLTVLASTLTSNETEVNGGGPAGGGGIQNLGTLFLANCTLAFNHAGNFPGGAIWNFTGGTMRLLACTIFGNTVSGTLSPGIGGFDKEILLNNTILADASDVTLLPGSSNNLFANPGLGAFGDYGGPTRTFPIGPASAAHKAGAADPGLTADQRGQARHAIPDIGAYEIFPRDPLLVSTPIDENDGNADSEQGTGTSLREALIHAHSLGGPQTITFAPSLAGQSVLLGSGWTDAADTSALRVSSDITLLGLAAAPGITLAIAPGAQKRHVQIEPGASLTLQSLTLTGGYAADDGGSIRNVQGSLTVRDCTFTGNIASEGGAIQARPGSPLLVLRNATFAGNTAANLASAISTGAASNSFQHITVTANNGPSVIFLNGSVVPIRNSIVAGNLADGILASSGGAFATDSAGNVFGTGNTAGVLDGVNMNVTGLAAPALLLASLSATPGGPTPTVALLPNSPAVNRGTVLPGFTGDQRGSPRVSGTAPDAGAFELTLTETTVVNTVADEFDVTSDARFGSGTSLREALHYSAGNISFSPSLTGLTVELTRIGDTAFGNSALVLSNQTFRFINASLAPRLTLQVNGSEPMRHVRIAPGGRVVFQNLTMSGGEASHGGAIYNQGTANISQVSFTGNHATQAGGVVLNDTNAVLTVSRSTFSGNSSDGVGGAIANRATATFSYATIAGNTAGTLGGGIHSEAGSAPIAMEATLVAANTDGLGAPSDLGGPQALAPTSAFNLIGPGGSGGLLDGANGNLVGVADPGLAPLAHYGGRTPTRALLPWSPAVDACLLAAAAFDQRGYPRDNPRDIGAFELRRSVSDVTLGDVRRVPPDGGGAGVIEFEFAADTAGATFSVYASPDLETPVGEWPWIGLVPETPPDSSQFRGSIPIDAGATQLFYRVQSP